MAFIQTIISFFTGHEAMFAGFGVAVLDFLFGINPNWKANGILHWIYLFLGGKSS